MGSDSFSLPAIFPKSTGVCKIDVAGVGLAITDRDADAENRAGKPRVSVVLALERDTKIETGDIFIEINKENVEGKTAKEIGNRLVGPVGSTVEIKFQKSATKELYSLTLERRLRYVLCARNILETPGFGFLLASSKDRLEIIGIIPGSAAEKGGYLLSDNSQQSRTIEWMRDDLSGVGSFEIGDVITSIDDQPVDGNDSDQVLKRFTEPEGSLMKLTMQRSGSRAEVIRMELRRLTGRYPCHVWTPIAEHREIDGGFSESELAVMNALNSRHAPCNFYVHPAAPKTFEWEERWSDSTARDPLGESMVRQLGAMIRQRKQNDPNFVFKDPFFPHSSSSLFVSDERTQRRTIKQTLLSPEMLRQVEWKRPNELPMYDGKPLEIWDKDIREDDVQQGQLSNCYHERGVAADLMAALSACASSEKDLLLRDLCVENDGDVGIYGVKFFVMGRWITVYVDDHFPCIRGANGKWKPVFASPKGAVLWPMIFEKAFAKMHRSYECTQLGSAADALQYLTGGVVEEQLLAVLSKDEEWKLLRDLTAKRDGRQVFIACGISAQGHGAHTAPSRVSSIYDFELRKMGLVRRHAYSVIQTKELNDATVRLVQIRNPWANETEWRGRYGDADPQWKKGSLAKDADFVAKDDGTFWMEHSDFRRYFDYLEICKPAATQNKQEGYTARMSGAASYWVAHESAGGMMPLNRTSSTFEYNPRFELRSGPSQGTGNDPIILTVYQPDPRYSSCVSLRDNKQAVEPMMDIFVYTRDDSDPAWTLKTQLYGGPQGDRFSTVCLPRKKRYEIIVAAKEPGMQGAFTITASGEGSVLSSCTAKKPDSATASIMVAKRKERWVYDRNLTSAKVKRQVGFLPALPAVIPLFPFLQVATFAVLGGTGLYGMGGSGDVDFFYFPQNLSLQIGRPLNLSHSSFGQLHSGSVSYTVHPLLPRGLVLNNSSGIITGSPLETSNGFSFWNISVKNISGRMLASTSIRLQVLREPITYDPSLLLLTINTSVSLAPVFQCEAFGLAFTIYPALPDGLSMNSDGLISGIPKSVSFSQTYNITAVNSYTQYVAAIRIEVKRNETEDRIEAARVAALERELLRRRAVEEMHYSDSDLNSFNIRHGHMERLPLFTYFAGRRISPVLKIIGSNYSGKLQFKADSLPDGLVLNRSDGAIYGSPKAHSVAQIWNISVFHGEEFLTYLRLRMQIIDPRKVKLNQKSFSLGRGDVIHVPILPDVDCSNVQLDINPGLPSDIQLKKGGQCHLTGEAAIVSDKTQYSVDLNWTSGSLSLFFSLEVVERLEPLIYAQGSRAYFVGERVTKEYPTNYFGKKGFNFVVEPKLPRGLGLDKDTGALYGSARSSSNLTNYTITVSDKAGHSRNCVLNVEVIGHNGIQFTYGSPHFNLAVNNSVRIPVSVKASLRRLFDNATFDSFPPLPLGMKLGAGGAIEGIPLFHQNSHPYIIRMSHPLIPDSSRVASLFPDGHGQVHTQVNLAILDGIKYVCYESLDSRYTVGKLIKENKPYVNDFSGNLKFSIDPKLPAGLDIEKESGIISGTPTASLVQTIFKVTAEDIFKRKATVLLRVKIDLKGALESKKGKQDLEFPSKCQKDVFKYMNPPDDNFFIASAMSTSFKSARRYVF